MKKIFLATLLLTFVNFSSAYAENEQPLPYKFVHYQYEVQEGDTLLSVSEKFITRNTYGERMPAEFTEGIIEANEVLWKNRILTPGQKIWINWFEKIDNMGCKL